MSHYPSSDELAAFRRAVRMPPSMNHSPLSRHRGAWTNERTDGIGNRNRPAWLSTADHSLARREASAMRSRAYSTSPVMHRVPGMPTYVHTYGGCSTCWDHQIDSKGPRVLCRQPVPDPEQPGICRWCKHAVSIGEYKWSNPESRAERLQRLRERTA